jgi:hypothetical protein
MKFVDRRPFTDPDAAARKLVEIANDVEAVEDGRIFIERVNAPRPKADVPRCLGQVRNELHTGHAATLRRRWMRDR